MIHEPPARPRDPSPARDPSPGALATAYAMALAVPVVLWAVSNPLAAVAGLAATVGLYGAARRVRAGVRRRLERRTVTVRLGTLVRITIARQPPEDCHPREHCCA